MLQETQRNLYEDSLAIEDSKSNKYIKEMLIEHEEFFRQYQPCDPNLNVNSQCTFDYYIRTSYRPDKNTEDVYKMISLTLILFHNRWISRKILVDEYFSDRLLADLNIFLKNVNDIDLEFLRLLDKFNKKILKTKIHKDAFQEIQENILAKLLEK